MLKGLLEGSILKIIAQKETYGYEITEKLNAYGFDDLNEGTVYPILMRLEKKGLVETKKIKSDLGPKRKYFYLNNEGRAFLKDFENEWQQIQSAVENVMKGEI